MTRIACQHQQGFTLLELMLATVLSALLLTGSFALISWSLKTWRYLEADASATRLSQQALDDLRRELEGVHCQRTGVWLETRTGQLRFLARIPDEDGLCLVAYGLHASSGELVKTVWPSRDWTLGPGFDLFDEAWDRLLPAETRGVGPRDGVLHVTIAYEDTLCYGEDDVVFSEKGILARNGDQIFPKGPFTMEIAMFVTTETGLECKASRRVAIPFLADRWGF